MIQWWSHIDNNTASFLWGAQSDFFSQILSMLPESIKGIV